ncbi:MAG: thiamine pyrophosphate-binding protein, partial [Candidatus Omnitrophota bacterium]
MKLSDYVARFLARRGIRHVFAITGGASCHFIDSIDKTPGIGFVCNQHEQASAMAADAYARVTSGFGCAIATSGPGATNLLTGVCCSYYDSIPAIYITGQVSTFRLKNDLGVRQLGFQETDVPEIFRPVTKYCVQLKDPAMIRYEMEKACYIAMEGRKGPVLIDIPDNLQRAQVDPKKLKSFVPAEGSVDPGLSKKIDECISLLRRAQRPVIILGWGIYLSGAQKEALRFLELSRVPVALTWAMKHLIPHDYPRLAGSFGTHGTRQGNFAVQNADLVISIGARLDTREAGTASTFARGAKKVIVDIDASELRKFARTGLKVDLPVQADARLFLSGMNARFCRISAPDYGPWQARLVAWKQKYPDCPDVNYERKTVDPYVFVKELSRGSRKGDVIFVDSGCGVAWLGQSFEFKSGQRFYSAFNNTPMGYALPASIGACFALNKKPVICVSGDGGLQMNIQELATVVRHDLPVKIFLLNNHGYSMIQQTQEQWLDSRYCASTVKGGLA